MCEHERYVRAYVCAKMDVRRVEEVFVAVASLTAREGAVSRQEGVGEERG